MSKACFQAFIDGDYSTIVDQAKTLLRSKPNNMVRQMIIISHQRLGQADRMDQYLQEILSAIPRDSLDFALLQVTLGQRDSWDVLDLARQRSFLQHHDVCSAHYYIGARLLTLNNAEGAHLAFDAAIATDAKIPEFLLARHERQSSLGQIRPKQEQAGTGATAKTISDGALDEVIAQKDFRRIDDLVGVALSLTPSQWNRIGRAMIGVAFGQLTISDRWFSLMKQAISQCGVLREHAFRILNDPNTAKAEGAYQTTDRSNLVFALFNTRLTRDEIRVIKNLQANITKQVYREPCEALLLRQVYVGDNG